MTPSGGTGSSDRVPPGGAKSDANGVVLLYAGTRAWFRSALEAVLQPEGIDVRWVRDVEEALDFVSDAPPDLIIVDENVRSASAPEVCRALRGGPLPEHVPIILYTSDMGSESVQAEALEAGAWEVIREPIRADSLIAALRRILRIGRLIGDAREDPLIDRQTGLLTARGLIRVLPNLEAMAERQGVALSCTVIGPTARGEDRGKRELREMTARLCLGHVREADVCGWVQEGDVAIVAFGTSPEGATTMAHRLHGESETLARDTGDAGVVLSAGVVQMHPAPPGAAGVAGEGEPGEERKRDPMSLLTSAQEALEAARQGGGGVRVVGTG